MPALDKLRRFFSKSGPAQTPPDHVYQSGPPPPPSTYDPPRYQAPYQPAPAPYENAAAPYPPADANASYAAPPGPPPSFPAPPGPRPSFTAPLGPPPSYEPSEDDVPPPAFYSLQLDSPASNAPGDLCDAGWAFTSANPLYAPSRWSPAQLDSIAAGALTLAPPPPHFGGLIAQREGVCLSTARGCPDTCLLSSLPVFAAGYHHPAHTGRDRSAYFEVTLSALPYSVEEAALAIGFVATPYPGFRLPGWNRGSVGVHGDDGRRYVNDSWGGKDFVAPFRAGDTVGVGMTWKAAGAAGTQVWFSRNGRVEGRWMLEEERDAREEQDALAGLGGDCDVFAAIGVFGGEMRADVRFFSEEEIERMPK